MKSDKHRVGLCDLFINEVNKSRTQIHYMEGIKMAFI